MPSAVCQKQEKSDEKARWAPRMWMGASASAWWRLLARNRFAIEWPYLYIAAVDSMTSLLNSTLRLVDRAIYGHAVARTEIAEPPIFIIGHWRSGTTLLHELLVLDERHTSPNNYQCFSPNHFLLTEKLFTRWFRFLMPERRPMDNMAVGWTTPQEDEFALCNLGQPSPYLTIAFPNRPQAYPEYMDLEGLPPQAVEAWKEALLTFFKQLTYKTPKRLVLKSPLHACRIKVLMELFPGAKFINIVRNPYVLYSSTMHMWKKMYAHHGLQTPRYAGLEAFVLRTFVHIHERLEATRGLIAPRNLHELRYEDLVANPVSQMRCLYERLDLGGFDRFLPALESYLASVADYRPNRYQLSPEERARVARSWRPYFEQYGYEV